MTEWIPRSQRTGERNLDGPYGGVPRHLDAPLRDWVNDRLFSAEDPDELAQALALRLRIPLGTGPNKQHALTNWPQSDELLDIVEGLLQMTHDLPREEEGSTEQLEQLLSLGGSAYTVSAEGLLVERVGEEAQHVMDAATATDDHTSLELREAWARAYGRSPNPSDAWDHSIKALESILGSIVEPNNPKATLGGIISKLERDPKGKFLSALPGSEGDSRAKDLAPTLRLIWPNPDRHGSGSHRTPTLVEARAVVTLTVALVQIAREDFLVALADS